MVSWYVVRTLNQSAAKHVFDSCEDIRETFYPMQHFRVGMSGIRRAKSRFPSYIFVRGDFKTIENIVRGSAVCELTYVKKDDMRSPMTVPDGEMELFKSFNENRLDMLWLRNPYQDFVKNDRARILSGPFAGYEGFVKEIKHDMKLIFRVGIWAIAISNVHKYDVAIVSRGEDTSEPGRIARLADYFAMAIRLAGVADNPYAVLRKIISGVGQCGTADKYIRSLTCSAGEDTAADDIGLCLFLRNLSGDDKGMLEQMARYIYSKEPHPVLTRLVPDMPLRPFLTTTPGGDGIAVEIKEGVYDAASDKAKEVTNTYFAHVMPLDNGGGSKTLITNWTYFFSQYEAMTPEAKALFLAKLDKFKLLSFRRCLSPDAPIRFMSFPAQGIAGLGIIVPTDNDIEQPRTELIRAGVSLCREIASSTRLRPWIRHLSTVWLR